MKTLVTGASGFLGGYVVEELVAAGHEVRALVRPTSRTRRLVALGVECVVGDMTDAESLERAVAGVEAVVHAAATMRGTPQEFEAATVAGTRAIVEAARRAGVRRFVHVSSIAVLSMAELPRGEAITEETPYESDPAFLGIYTASKLKAEREALARADDGTMQVVVIRPGLLYGPQGKWVLPRMGYALGRNAFAVVGMGGNTLPVCYVRNCARAIRLALERDGLDGETFNIVDDEPVRQGEYLRLLKRHVRPKLKVVRVPYVVARCVGFATGLGMKLLKRGNPIATSHLKACVRRLRYSNGKAKAVLGWTPVKSTAEALDETMRSFADAERLSRRADLKALGRPPAGARPITACLIGCGVIAETHLHTLRRMENARVLAVCDAVAQAAQRVAAEFGVPKTYTDAAAMIEAERPDLVHVLTPPQTHAPLALMALERGAHVYVEKPMAMDADEARRMVACAERAGRHLCVGHNHLFDPVMVRARRLIESGAAGEVIWAESYYGFDLGNNLASRYMLPGGGAHWTFHVPGGLYQNLAPHPLSVALDVIGRPDSIRAEADPCRVVPHQPTDELRVNLRGAGGAGLIVVSLAASPRFQYLDIHGRDMRITVDFLNQWLVCEGVGRGMPKPLARALANFGHGWTVLRGTAAGMVKVLLRRWTPYAGMALLIRECYAALQRGEAPPVSGEDGLLTMEIMDEVWRQIGPLT